MSDVRAVGEWRNNAELIEDVARLGYLDGTVLDVTYGEGAFWRRYTPPGLLTNDLHKPNPTGLHDDYRALTFESNAVDVVVFDPPYKLNGTPAMGAMDDRYGTGQRRTRDEILDEIVAGALEGLRVTRRHLLVKVQDQVEGGQVRWQTDIVTDALTASCTCGHDELEHDGETAWCTWLDADAQLPPCTCSRFRPRARKVDRFDLVTTPRPQPGGRRQLTARRNHSTLLVFIKENPRP